MIMIKFFIFCGIIILWRNILEIILSIYLFVIINKTLRLLLNEFFYFCFHFHFHYCHCYYYSVFSYFYSHILFLWTRKYSALARSRTDGLKLLRNSLDLVAEDFGWGARCALLLLFPSAIRFVCLCVWLMCLNTRIDAEREGKKEKEGRGRERKSGSESERGRDMERDYINTMI